MKPTNLVDVASQGRLDITLISPGFQRLKLPPLYQITRLSISNHFAILQLRKHIVLGIYDWAICFK